ncbi:MAG: chorismate mutase, partial [Eubacterium sp.]|nr:chorismate mutase [Eubacterium sp.]
MVDLKESRNKIDKIDSSIVELFEERMLVANEVAEYKRGSGKAVFDPERENQKLDSLEELASTAFNKRAVRELFSQVMSISKKYQYDILKNTDPIKGFDCVDKLEYDENTRVCYFGSPGSYTQQAMEEFFGTNMIGISNGTFKEVMEKVQSGEADYGVLPIENSSTGGISTNYDIIINYDNNIVGEHVVKIDQCLMALPGTKMDEIKTIYSHEQGLKQCSQFLANYPQIKQIEYASTSDSAKKVSIDQDKTKAAIGSARAAKEYGLEIIKENIQQETNNSTRFIVISNKDIYKKGSNRI